MSEIMSAQIHLENEKTKGFNITEVPINEAKKYLDTQEEYSDMTQEGRKEYYVKLVCEAQQQSYEDILNFTPEPLKELIEIIFEEDFPDNIAALYEAFEAGDDLDDEDLEIPPQR